ncbi:GIY-YIG_2 [Cafeteriavirus-dependent mavirus]|nr:GIY-YIG_2 [Cafeteriavirus-dependent mavirus]CAK6624537.1 GIY-YIG_2 [Cafeteriavirus-dependent mavirus]
MTLMYTIDRTIEHFNGIFYIGQGADLYYPHSFQRVHPHLVHDKNMTEYFYHSLKQILYLIDQYVLNVLNKNKFDRTEDNEDNERLIKMLNALSIIIDDILTNFTGFVPIINNPKLEINFLEIKLKTKTLIYEFKNFKC